MDEIINQIAHMHLGISTLETRQRDHLDFYDVSVWSVKAALEAAYKAGQQGTTALPPPVSAQAGRPRKATTQEVVAYALAKGISTFHARQILNTPHYSYCPRTTLEIVNEHSNEVTVAK